MRCGGKSVLVFSLALAGSAGCGHQTKALILEADPIVWAEAPKMTPEEAEVAASIQDQTVHFDFDSSYLSFENREKLQRVADAMRKRPNVNVMVAGHCDEVGTEEYNLALGQRRAEGTRRYLEALGVSEARIRTISYGKERPVDSRREPEAYAVNRRAEFEVLPEMALR